MLDIALYSVTLITLFMHPIWTLSIHNTSQAQQLPNQSSKYVSCLTYKQFPQEILPPLHKRPQPPNQSDKHVTSVTTETMNSQKNTSTTFNSFLSSPYPLALMKHNRVGSCRVFGPFLTILHKNLYSHFNSLLHITKRSIIMKDMKDDEG